MNSVCTVWFGDQLLHASGGVLTVWIQLSCLGDFVYAPSWLSGQLPTDSSVFIIVIVFFKRCCYTAGADRTVATHDPCMASKLNACLHIGSKNTVGTSQEYLPPIKHKMTSRGEAAACRVGSPQCCFWPALHPSLCPGVRRLESYVFTVLNEKGHILFNPQPVWVDLAPVVKTQPALVRLNVSL